MTAQDPFFSEEFMEVIGPLLALKEDIEMHTAFRPTAMMLPLSRFPDAEQICGLPVVRGYTEALIFEPPKPKY